MRARIAVLILLAVGMTAVLPAVDEVSDLALVRPGARGECLTEMEDGEIVSIPLTVIGTLGPSTPEGEIVLVRLEDPRFETTGIIAGMSGSPVYLDGRLLGALAFGWRFSREPVGGVTPFSRMRSLAVPSAGADVSTGSAAAASRPELVELVRAWRDGRLGSELVDWLAPAGGGAPERLPLAVSLTGLHPPGGAGWVAQSWERLGWVAAPGGVEEKLEPRPVIPGAMVAGVLISGDASLAVGGTVTEVRGDQVWAFGHPFLGGGGLRLPMARASVVGVLPSLMSSFKFFSVGPSVGALTVDRTHGVWGRLGETVSLLPVEVEASGRTYSYRAVRDPALLPLLVGYLVQASHAVRGRVFGDQTVRALVEVEYHGGRVATLEESFVGGDASSLAAGLAAALVGYLEATPFQAPELEAVRVRLEARERLEMAEIVDVVPSRSVVRPGEEIDVRIRLRTHRQGLATRMARVRVPAHLPAGRLDLVVADGASWSVYDLAQRPTRPASFADELRLVGRLRPSTTVVVALERKGPGLALPGGTVEAPPSVVISLSAGLGPNLSRVAYHLVGTEYVALPYPVLGAVRVRLKVRVDGAPLASQGDTSTAAAGGAAVEMTQ